MIFYVRKMLTSGLIRFGVGERAASVSIANPPELFSTGPSGEYHRRSEEGLYFAEERGEKPAELMPSVWSVRQRSSLSVASKIVMGFGGVILLFGILLLVRKGDPIAWIEILLGLAMIFTPMIRTAKLRRELREQAERERGEREAEERRNREIVGAFAASLEALRRDPGAAMLERVRGEREGREIPYEAVAPLARETVRQIGFEALSRFDSLGPEGVGGQLHAVCDAVGLSQDDRKLVKRHLWQKLVWHLLADDRMSEAHQQSLEALRLALRIEPEEIATDRDAMQQFAWLRGLTLGNLPQVDAPIPLRFQEVCHHRSRGERRKRAKRGAWVPAGERNLTVTSRRVVVSNRGEREISYEEIREIEVDVDERLLTIETIDPGRSRTLRIPDSIYTAGVIAIASKTPRKPKGLV